MAHTCSLLAGSRRTLADQSTAGNGLNTEGAGEAPQACDLALQRMVEECNALLEHATKEDDHLREIGEEDRIDDKTVFIIKRA